MSAYLNVGLLDKNGT